MAEIFGGTALTGGASGALDAIPVTGTDYTIDAGDIASVTVSGILYPFYADNSGDTESSPWKVKPDFSNVAHDAYSGTIRWKLASFNALAFYSGVNDGTRGFLHLYGDKTGLSGGGETRFYNAADYDGTIDYFAISSYEDDLLIGPNTDTDALKLTSDKDFLVTAGSIILSAASEYINFGASTQGSSGYGIRDNSGVMEAKTSSQEWGKIAIIPSGTKMLFYANTAPTGWTIDSTPLNDKLVYVTKGSDAGGQTGGQPHSTGTWTISGITSEHNHQWYEYTSLGGDDYSWQSDGSTTQKITVTGTRTTGFSGIQGRTDFGSDMTDGALTVDLFTQDTSASGTGNGAWRPDAYCFIVCSRN